MSLIDTLISSVAPHECIKCGLQGWVLCDLCADEHVSPLPSRCFRCLKRTADNKTCSNCRRITKISHLWPASEYTEEIANVIKEYKYGRKRNLDRPLAGMLHATLPYFSIPPIVVPIPTAPSRVRARGYDHTKALAKQLALIRGWRSMELIRREGAQHQVGANRYTRLHQLEGAFRPIRESYISDQTILLLDDVVTTGATLSIAARALKSAGANSIYCAVIAHKS